MPLNMNHFLGGSHEMMPGLCEDWEGGPINEVHPKIFDKTLSDGVSNILTRMVEVG